MARRIKTAPTRLAQKSLDIQVIIALSRGMNHFQPYPFGAQTADDPGFDMAAAAATWREHREAIERDFIRENPGERPWAFWAFTARPRVCQVCGTPFKAAHWRRCCAAARYQHLRLSGLLTPDEVRRINTDPRLQRDLGIIGDAEYAAKQAAKQGENRQETGVKVARNPSFEGAFEAENDLLDDD